VENETTSSSLYVSGILLPKIIKIEPWLTKLHVWLMKDRGVFETQCRSARISADDCGGIPASIKASSVITLLRVDREWLDDRRMCGRWIY